MDRIGICGLGNMGEAIVKALARNGMKGEDILALEIKGDKARYMREEYGIRVVDTIGELMAGARHILLAVKPQDSKALLKSMASAMRDDQILLSIMAGITISNMASTIDKEAKIVRIMPNIAVKVGEGAIGITHNTLVTREEMDEIVGFLCPLGRIIEVGEELMDAVTALGGSGPAFFLLFLEGMIDGGVRAGIPRDKSRLLAFQVVKGAMKMLEEENLHPTLMKEMITSPGGTTVAGLAVLEEKALKGAVVKAVEETTKRARELSL